MLAQEILPIEPQMLLQRVSQPVLVQFTDAIQIVKPGQFSL
jgi:hypothetical protein